MKRRVLGAVLPLIVVVVLAGSGSGTAAATGALGAARGQPWTGSQGITRSIADLAARQRRKDRRTGGKPRHIRQKPEPGGGEGQPKLPGPAAPQRPVRTSARATAGPSVSLSTGTSFLGAQVSEAGFIPPDSMGSVGPAQVLVAVNGRIKVFDKQGNLGPLNVSDSTFWSPVRNGSGVTDPQVEYDRLAGRWIVSAVNLENTNNRVMLAVSSGSTITGSSDFTFFSFNHNAPPPAGDGGLFADYPQMGVDENAVYIGINDFAGNTFSNTSAFVIRKSSVLGSGPIVVTAFRGLAVAGGQGPFTPQPAQDMDPSVDEGYLIGVDNQVFSQLDVRRVSDPGGTPTISPNLTVPVPPTYFPDPVPAQGTHNSLDALDDRLFEAMIARKPGGALSLWTAHNIAVNSSGVGGQSGDRTAARWYEIGSLSGAPTITQSGTLFDPAASSPRFFWIPSIAANGQGHASLNSSAAGSGRFAEVASSGRLESDPAGATQPFDITQSSSSTYNLGQGPTKRWGDYSQTVVDPTDNMTFWTFQEYANATDSWGVRVIQLKAPPPATPSAASPSAIPQSQSSVNVQITGTSSNGSGFFDPGSGFPDHISASVSGGVGVNGVDFNDPTHVTLDLDTTAASNGPKDVTITNPDGQSRSGSNIVTVGSDTTPPDPPTLTGTDPSSPANENSPKVLGTAEGGSTVKIYKTSDCSGAAATTGSAAEFASPGLAVSVPDDSTTTFRATATDAADNASGCSSSSATYVEDSTDPGPPTLTGTDPSSPANDNSPKILGNAEGGSTVKLYTNATCTGAPAATGSAAEFASPGLAVSVPDDSTTTFHATATDAAGNTSTCSSGSVTYVEDSTLPDTTPPDPPTLTGTDPSSPANENSPKVLGTAEGGSMVKLYETSDCSGSAAATGSAADFASPGLTVSVPNDSTTTFRATATDAADNTSGCSSGSVIYVEDSTPPDTVIDSGPSGTTTDDTPTFTFHSTEPSSTFECSIDTGTANFGPCSGPGASHTPSSPLDDGTYTFRVRATDHAGNTDSSPATQEFTVQAARPPDPPTLTGTSPASPADDNSPKILGDAEAGSTVKLYKTSDCSGAAAATGSAAEFASPGLGVSVPNDSTTTFRATATDAADNTSGCSSSSVTYVEDSTAADTVIDSGPSGLTTAHTPTFTFHSTESSSTFECSIDTGTANFGPCSGPGASHTPSSPLADGTYTFRVRATDQASNPDPTPATRVFTVQTPVPGDVIPPETTITKKPNKKTHKRRPKFKFVSSELDSGFQCSVDKKPLKPCTSPFRPRKKLKLGKHVFRAEAIDPSGNVDDTPAKTRFKIIP